MAAGPLTVVAPVFLLIALGFGAVRLGLLGAEVPRALGLFVLRLAMPALIFRAMTRAPLGETLDAGFTLAYGAATLALFGSAFLLARRLGAPAAAAAMQALGASGANSGFIGFPLVTMAFGASVAGPVLAQCMVVENLALIPLALLIAEAGQGRAAPRAVPWAVPWAVLRGLATNPLLIGLAAGLGFALTGLALPEVLAAPMDLLAATAAPLALVAVGGTLAMLRPEERPAPAAFWPVAAKLVLHPALFAAALALLAPGTPPLLAAGGILSAAAPMISIYPVIAARFGLGGPASALLLAATVAAAATLPAVLWLVSP